MSILDGQFMEMKFTPHFKEFLKAMGAHHVEFVIIGGYAVTFHGFPRLTHDIDFLVGGQSSNWKRLTQALIEFGFQVKSIPNPLFTTENPIIRFGIPPNRIELFEKIPGVQWKECWENRITTTIEQIPVNWVGLRELRLNKMACDRDKDRIDLAELPES